MGYDGDHGHRCKKEQIDVIFLWKVESPQAGDQCVVQVKREG